MLQARIFSYADAHRYRVGTWYEALPVNRPIIEVAHYHANGAMRFDEQVGSDAYYEPNSFGGPVEDRSLLEPPFGVDGDGYRYDHRKLDDDYYSQPRTLFHLMNDEQKAQLFSNIAAAMEGVPQEIIDRQLALFEKIDTAYKADMQKALR